MTPTESNEKDRHRTMRPLSIPVILGTTRKGRTSAPAAQFVYGQLKKRDGITTELIHIASLNLPVDDAGEAIKDPRFSASMERSDASLLSLPNTTIVFLAC